MVETSSNDDTYPRKTRARPLELLKHRPVFAPRARSGGSEWLGSDGPCIHRRNALSQLCFPTLGLGDLTCLVAPRVERVSACTFTVSVYWSHLIPEASGVQYELCHDLRARGRETENKECNSVLLL